MSEYKFTYFLNTACAERRPQTRRDLIEDWKEEEREYPTALEAFEHAYIEILDNDEEDLQDLYEENGIGPNDEVKKLEALKNDFDCIDPGDGSTILISIEGEGPIDSYDSGFTKESFNDDYMEDDDYDDDDYLDENKKLNESYLTYEEIDKKIQEILNQCLKNHRFTRSQYYEIQEAAFHGLTFEQVKILVNPQLSPDQIHAIRCLIEENLSLEQIKPYIKPYEDLSVFDADQIDIILYGITHNLTTEQVQIYAKPEISWKKMNKILNKLLGEEDYSEDYELTKHVEVEDNGEECPYISGWCDEDIEIYDRGDLSEDELWATGWVGSVQNLNEGPFKSFIDIDICCSDNEKGSEYDLPDISENIQKEFVEKVNKWIEENPDELDENKELNEDEQLEIDEQGLPVLEHPYSLRKRNDDRFQIISSHPYDMTEYSYAISKNNDINSDWEVYDPENPRTIVSDYSARKTTLEGIYKGWNEVLDAMKRIDSNKKRRIDRT